MESPVSVVKSAIQPGTIIKAVIGFIVVAAIFDLAGLTTWLLYPVSSAKAKFAAASATAAT